MPKNADPSDQNVTVPSIPPIPSGLPVVELEENALEVFRRRYMRKDEDDGYSETKEETFWRVAYSVAAEEASWGGDVEATAREFYHLLANKCFLPNSPTFTGAGTPLGQLAACFVLPISDDMGKWSDGIFKTLLDAALIQQTGGGNGFSFSRLRPTKSLIKASSGRATGPVGFLKVYDKAFGEIAQGGTRRGANMAVLRVDHPDIEQFITCKTDETAITNFNISVGITDAFMEAVINDDPWELRFPDVKDPVYREFNGTLEQAEDAGIPILVHETLRARDLFDKIVSQAHHNGEPGLLFLDHANRENPIPHLYDLEATNPCGEQYLGPYENCCLGSINLSQHFLENGLPDWEGIKHSTEIATRFLDNVVDANAYVPAVPELKKAAMRARRIGLGIMGLADLMYRAGVRYGSERGQEFAAQIMEFIRYHAMLTSIKLAEMRGPFPAIEGSLYDPNDLRWKAPESIIPYKNDWGRPALDWTMVTDGILEHGIRNAAQTTIAPTGTIATVSGCEGYGCEPVFALAYTRHVVESDGEIDLTYTSPLFEDALRKTQLNEDQREEIIEDIIKKGTCRDIELLPEDIKDTFVVSGDITAEEHIRVQAALQAFVDNSISKTINFSSDAQPEDVSQAYILAWESGCKGITVYVTGSRDKVVLETGRYEKPTQNEEVLTQLSKWQATKKPRPRHLKGYTFSIQTPLGKTYVTINENGDRQPFEVFINTAKAGSDTAAVSEAIGRSLSYILRMSSPIPPRQRLEEVYQQYAGIGGRRPTGFGPNRVRSLPDGIAQALQEYLENTGWNFKDVDLEELEEVDELSYSKSWLEVGDLCPECGQAALVNEEGCRKCYSCGYSEC
ncbi:MAG TPA: adenosylcobalamin-dependent ribonucleoside-diphosphate reductase [Chloroflexi bacterium]|nr:MAG: ribonucleoside-diphosphate reductase, adenosylcobalamin-dependent [Chloroflexota bacterium]HDD55426.1 adenosylcobalamin-dependent ribonucleoside-diphosphate reductase [Chloroflexota bacterium]